MPGGAAHTAGIELTQCAAVATIPSLLAKSLLDAVGLKSLDGDGEVGIALALHLVAFPGGPERPRRFEVLLPHEPVHGDAHDHLVADERLPVEPSPRHLSRLDGAHRRVDRRGRHRDLLGRVDLRIGGEAHLVHAHPDRLNEPAVEQFLHGTGERLLRRVTETHDVPQHVRGVIGA